MQKISYVNISGMIATSMRAGVDLRNRISMIRDEAYRGLIGDLPEKFLEKYFTPDVMMELLEEQFLAEGNHREITAIIEAREILS